MTTTRDVQARLKELGIYGGPLDGIEGPATTAAVRAFQRVNGLTVDGRAGPKTRAALWPAPIAGRDDDPPQAEPAHVPAVWPRQADVPAFFGAVGTRQTMLPLPYPMKIAWDRRVVITRISLHEKVAESAGRVLAKVAATYSPAERMSLGLDLFGGSLNVRPMRGGTRYSMHSWGIAIDIDPDRNQLRWGRDRARLAHPDALPFWQAWEAEGWVSLGRVRNMDWMHVQAARL